MVTQNPLMQSIHMAWRKGNCSRTFESGFPAFKVHSWTIKDGLNFLHFFTLNPLFVLNWDVSNFKTLEKRANVTNHNAKTKKNRQNRIRSTRMASIIAAAFFDASGKRGCCWCCFFAGEAAGTTGLASVETFAFRFVGSAFFPFA